MVTIVQAIHIVGDALCYDSFQHTDELINALKVLRNNCNGDSSVADSFIAYDAVDLIVKLCHRIVIDRALMGASINRYGDGDRRDDRIVLLCSQVLANFSASGDKYRDHLFDTTTSTSSVRSSSISDKDKQPAFEALQYVLSAIVISNNRSALMVFVSMLYNCVHNSPERCLRLCSHREMLCPLLLGVFEKSGLLAVDGGATNSSRDDELLQWYHMLSYAWCRNGMYSTVFETVQSHRSSGGAAIHEHRAGSCSPLSDGQSVYADGGLPPIEAVFPTHEQLVVLQLSLDVFEDPHCAAAIDRRMMRMHPDYETSQRRSSTMLGTYLLTVARLLCSVDLESAMFTQSATMMSFTPQRGSIPITTASVDEIDEKDRLLQRELRLDFIHLGTQVIASGLSFISDDDDADAVDTAAEDDSRRSCGEHIKDTLVQKTAILSQLIRVLKGRDASTRKLRASVDCSPAVNDDDARVKDIMRYSLQLLGNLVYRCFPAQEALREVGGLAVLLCYCGTDFDNPFTREWALLAVRNACDNNLENQRFIDSLQPQEISIQSEELKKLGMQVKMSGQTGKFSFVPT